MPLLPPLPLSTRTRLRLLRCPGGRSGSLLRGGYPRGRLLPWRRLILLLVKMDQAPGAGVASGNRFGQSPRSARKRRDRPPGSASMVGLIPQRVKKRTDTHASGKGDRRGRHRQEGGRGGKEGRQ